MSKRELIIRKGLFDLDEVTLKTRIQEDKLRLKKLKFAHVISPLENPMSIRLIRKNVARLKTVLSIKVLGFKQQ